MQKVDEEVRRIIDEQYAIARKLIEDNRDKMEAMTQALLEWETIDADQINDIMEGRPPRPPKDYSDTKKPGSSGNPPPSDAIKAEDEVTEVVANDKEDGDDSSSEDKPVTNPTA